MAFARPKPDANSFSIYHRCTELSDVIRARNKREDRLLDVRIKFYERDTKIRLNLLKQQQNFFQRTRATLLEEVHRLQLKKEHEFLFNPAFAHQRTTSPFFITEWETNLNENQSEIVLPTIQRSTNFLRTQTTIF